MSRHKWMPYHSSRPSPTTHNPPPQRNPSSMMTMSFYSMFSYSFYSIFKTCCPLIRCGSPLTRLYRGPFLNERYLPPRRIPSLDVPEPHDSGVVPVPNDASPVCPEQVQDAGVKSIPNSQRPPLPQPGEPSKTRDGSSGSLSGAPSPANPPITVASSQRHHHELHPELNTAQKADPELPNRLSQPGAPNAESVVASEKSQGLAGREVAFVEPEKQTTSVECVSNIPRHEPESQDGGEDRQNVAGPDAMDLDETPGRPGEAPKLISFRPLTVDAARPPDILSSPGSTAQTATTPAVHEASPDTSPDNEGPQYPGDDDDLEHKMMGKTPEKLDAALEEEEVAPRAGDSGASQAAAAQLLAESADAIVSTASTTLQSPVDLGRGAHISAKATTSTRPATEDASAEAETNPEKVTVGLPPTVQSPRKSQQRQATPGAQGAPSVDNGASPGTASSVASADQHTPGPPTSISASFNDAVTQSPAQQSAAADIELSTSARAVDAPGLQQHEGGVVDSLLRKRSLAEKHGLKHKRVPTVLFEKPPKKQDETIVASQSQGRYHIPTDDYFVSLFVDGFTRQSNWMKSSEQLLGNTHKTLSSGDCSIVLQENQACKVLRRIYHLQQSDKWSLRQPKRCPEPTRPPTHWDLLLQEMKWMRTDFREERKWKRAAARNLAEACAEWVASGEEERKVLQVNAKIPPPVGATLSSKDAAEADSLPTPMPDLVPSADADSPMDIDEEPQDWQQTIAPSVIFALQNDEIVFGLQKSAASDQLLDELPLYSEPLKAPQPDLVVPEYDPDARWRRPAIPLSKYVEGEMVLKPARSRLQQSRFKYAVEDDEDDFEIVGAQERDERTKLPPANTDVALFRPDMKMIRDRLHAGVKFRPPTESLMPLQSFYENRIASAWTSEQDDELRKEVREHSYNWSLISQIISPKSLFVSAEDRRTPWECFERWVQLEGFPNDAARTQYFQTYQRRIDSAQRAIAQANENARPQVGPNGAVTPVQRRRSTLPYRVDRKTSKRHFAIIDAMKKLAKKREVAIAKQQQTANNQNRRTSNDNAQQKLPTKTPEDYSRLRHEREKQMHEKLMRFTQQQEAQRQVSPMDRRPQMTEMLTGLFLLHRLLCREELRIRWVVCQPHLELLRLLRTPRQPTEAWQTHWQPVWPGKFKLRVRLGPDCRCRSSSRRPLLHRWPQEASYLKSPSI